MPHTSAIYQKSAKGSQAISTRDHALAPKLRSMLILVDGKRGFDELAKLSSLLGNTDELLTQLLDQGYIEPAAHAAAAPAPAHVPVSAPAPLQHAAVPLAEAQRFAVRRLTDILGPTGEDLCMRIEGTKNAQEFMSAIKRAEAVLRDFGGDKLAESFNQEVQAHRPG
jgi:hypothetical protein